MIERMKHIAKNMPGPLVCDDGTRWHPAEVLELVKSMEGELEAWRSRFPDYTYRRQDECVSLNMERVKYGCFIDLCEEGDEPDGCVIDEGEPHLCIYAERLVAQGKGKLDCKEWKPTIRGNL